MIVNNLFKLNKKKIIVTGSNSGIGLELSRSLLKLKVTLIRIDLRFSNKLKSTDYVADLKEKSQVVEVFKKIKKKFGNINGLVNCAGISIASENPYFDIDYYENTMNINLKSAFIVTAETCKMMKNNGSVINLTSLGAEQCFPNNPAYQASKAGLKQLTKAFARDYSKLGIRFNNICPGYIKSKMTIKSYLNPASKRIRSNRTLLGSWGKPSDLVGPAIFLLSDASKYITGTDIYVDGGWLAKGI
jgi:NAD(P)-dependent dehydrogenase (short-subunit alcohol dehydrogenase family)